MPTERKIEMVEQLTDLLSKNKFVVATDYRGMSVAEIMQLRRQLREIGTEYHVVKNNLAKFAAEKAGKPGLSQFLQGPIALAFCHKDATQLAKTIANYIRSSKTSFSVKGGVLDVRVLTAEEVFSLATLPHIDVLRARLLGLLQSPIYSLQNVLNANLRGLNIVLKARIQQLGGTSNV
jgi:large subunit ribosomal protein L10